LFVIHSSSVAIGGKNFAIRGKNLPSGARILPSGARHTAVAFTFTLSHVWIISCLFFSFFQFNSIQFNSIQFCSILLVCGSSCLLQFNSIFLFCLDHLACYNQFYFFVCLTDQPQSIQVIKLETDKS